MTTELDPDDFDLERSRAAVAIACLEWLRCTGPSPDASRAPSHPEAPARNREDNPFDHRHPLWDRWIDG
jgi:hypothetical protein